MEFGAVVRLPQAGRVQDACQRKPSCVLAKRHWKGSVPGRKPLAAQLQHLLGLGRDLRCKVRNVRHDDLIEPGGKPLDEFIDSGIGGTCRYPGGRGHAQEIGAAQSVVLAAKLEG